MNELQWETVNFLEHRRVFHAERRELIDVEEPAIVDFLRGHSPVREAIRLLVEQSIEIVEASRLAGNAVEVAHARLDERRHAGAGSSQHGETPLHDLLLARARRRVLWIARAPPRKVAAGCEDAL